MPEIDWFDNAAHNGGDSKMQTFKYGDFLLTKFVNNIVIGCLGKHVKSFDFLDFKRKQKLKKNTVFMRVDDKDFCLPFDCIIMELAVPTDDEDYCFIVLMDKNKS
ncbi:hypothetical protein COBT_001280 [Conglomerata obtusa]